MVNLLKYLKQFNKYRLKIIKISCLHVSIIFHIFERIEQKHQLSILIVKRPRTFNKLISK